MNVKTAIEYVTYLIDPTRHTNAASTNAGIGSTRQESIDASTYYSNQLPWGRTVPISRAPRWAVEEARQAAIETAYWMQEAAQ